MEAENVINLLDSYWYDLDFFKRTKPTNYNIIPQIPSSNINTCTLPTIHTKSSQQLVEKMSLNFISSSPNSVLQSSPKLQTIFSGKETNEFDHSKSKNQSQEQQKSSTTTSSVNSSSSCSSLKGNNNNNIGISRTRKKKRLSKSLSDLEFEELKGFMDLGFVFSEEDHKDSTLVSIIPGLQRLGNNNNNNNDRIINKSDNNIFNNNVSDGGHGSYNDKSGVSRPYLSEAWEVLEKKKKESSTLLKWKVPASTDQIDMKDYLKSWAHNVASTVK